MSNLQTRTDHLSTLGMSQTEGRMHGRSRSTAMWSITDTWLATSIDTDLSLKMGVGIRRERERGGDDDREKEKERNRE